MRTIWLHPAELFVARIVTIVIGLDAVLVALRGSSVDVEAYSIVTSFVAVALAIGLACRRSRHVENIGTLLVSVSLLLSFSASVSVFNYLLTPNPNPVIDPWLQAADAAFGYQWADAISWAADHPTLNKAIRFAYTTTMLQILLLVSVLALTQRLRDLHSLILTLTITCLIAILFWGLFPTVGASAFNTIPDGLVEQVKPVLGPEYGTYMLGTVRDGVSYLSPNDFRGLVSFPSFHTVLALALAWHARHVGWVLLPYLIAGLLVLPATLVHGAHHLVDIPAGMAVFAFGLWGARTVLDPATARVALPAA